ncbi:hypothetical protein C1634_021035 [Chryseobacterium viscerum]|uniref:Uncharacterized protein n=1 Tax=Chryseobacterium viscerum TaxID=1037377 RepID=A0A316WDH7_9FLAO|nr:hypothetical protein C1634_021035 [Chryseobacterium viscerum]
MDKVWITFPIASDIGYNQLIFKNLQYISVFAGFPQYKIMWISFVDKLSTFFLPHFHNDEH